MEYSDFIYLSRYYFPVVTAIFFFIKLIGGASEDRKHSLVIFFVCLLYFCIPEVSGSVASDSYMDLYVEALFVVILIAGAGMLSMFALVPFDRKAFLHAIIFTFIITINFMLTWHYTVSSQPLVYAFFDELIIFVSILQITVSSDGFTQSFSNIIKFIGTVQGFVVGVFVHCLRLLGNLQTHKESKG